MNLRIKKKSEEYEKWFLRYRPADGKNMNEGQNTENLDKKTKTKRKINKRRKTKKRKGFFF